jgi:hypothetical protein
VRTPYTPASAGRVEASRSIHGWPITKEEARCQRRPSPEMRAVNALAAVAFAHLAPHDERRFVRDRPLACSSCRFPIQPVGAYPSRATARRASA